MKLDKIAFAHVVAHCVSNGMSAGEYEVTTLDRLIDIEVPDASNFRASVSDVDAMLKAICEDRKIEVIKAYRNITGQGLKESKDAIEANWFRQPSINS